jgi:hypothetical protein
MNQTLQLLRTILSYSENAVAIQLTEQQKSSLYKYSIKNRMPLLYLEALGKSRRTAFLKLSYKEKCQEYQRTFDAITRISSLLTENNVEHAVFKTIRPYKSTTVDIDIIIFGDRNNYLNAIESARDAKYKVVVYGPRSTTLWDQEANIGVDLYEQVAVSFISYIDKERLLEYINTSRLPNGGCVKTLKPEADLACIIGHSIIKEQMYTLSEYYSFISYLEKMSIDNLLEIARQNNIISAIRTHASITALLYKISRKNIPYGLKKIQDSLGEDSLETTRLINKNFKIPHKYHPITIAKSLLEISKGKATRNSMATQIIKTLNPQFGKKFLRALMDHFRRETY